MPVPSLSFTHGAPEPVRAGIEVFQPQPPALARLTARVKESVDPRRILSEDVLRSFVHHGGGYVPMPDNWLPAVGLGLTVWEGTFQRLFCKLWLRWCDERGGVGFAPVLPAWE